MNFFFDFNLLRFLQKASQTGERMANPNVDGYRDTKKVFLCRFYAFHVLCQYLILHSKSFLKNALLTDQLTDKWDEVHTVLRGRMISLV